MEEEDSDMALIVEGKYRLNRKVGEGAYGLIFAGTNKNTHEEVAVKIERCGNTSPLRNEARIYAALRGINGVPKMRSWGTEGKYNYLVVDLLGETLEDRRVSCGGKLSLKQVMSIGLQMLERIRDIHNCGLVHRDVKPANFIFGSSAVDRDVLYVIDFGMTKIYRKGRKHICLTKGHSMIGTLRFASIHTHCGLTPSRRDDIESLGYILVYLLTGDLPWKQQCVDERSIANMKLDSTIWSVLREYSVNEKIIVFLKYARKLEYEEKPDYEYLFGLLHDQCNK